MLYFAYGSNLHHLQMKKRCKDSIFLKKINLKDFRLTFRSKYKAADIEPKRNSIVPGGLFEISKSDEKKLDVYEDFPILYKKYYFSYYGKKIMTYTMVNKTKFRYPTERYYNIVKKGYNDCDLDLKYLQKALTQSNFIR
ncbi:gamma-glutamylcyclotransferase [Candidatus Pelagibacter sp.]|nr:gamma-glutamylcyclotransferase [Candidatus Pelagibacter sp.]